MITLKQTSVVIPFRLDSSRFPNKALAIFRGRTLLEHALSNAMALEAHEIVVTASVDDLHVASRVVNMYNHTRLVPSSASCASATERVVQIRKMLNGKMVLCLPVDEPTINPVELKYALEVPNIFEDATLATTFYCDFFTAEDYLSPLSAKIIVDQYSMLLYMSRSVIPVMKDGTVDPAMLKKNVGVFVFTPGFLAYLDELKCISTILDRHEGLEQLRWRELGLRVYCKKINHIGFGIDIPEQLTLLEQRMEHRK